MVGFLSGPQALSTYLYVYITCKADSEMWHVKNKYTSLQSNSWSGMHHNIKYIFMFTNVKVVKGVV